MKKSSFCLGMFSLLTACAQTAPPQASRAPANTLNVADAAIAGGDPGMALSVSQSVLKSDPGDENALLHEGDAYYALGRCPDAIAAYRLALQRQPKSSDAETGAGRCLLKTDPASAEAAFAAAVQDNPGNAAAWDDLGIARDLRSNFAGAAQAYRQSLLAAPGAVPTEVNLGLSLALGGDAAQGLQYLGPLAAGQEATARIREDYATALIAAGRSDEARQVLSIDLPADQVAGAVAGLAAMLDGSNRIVPQ